MKTTISNFYGFIIFLFLSIPMASGQSQEESILTSYLDNYYQSTYNKKLYIQTDKYLYENGEQIWMTMMALDRKTHLPIKGNLPIIVQIVNLEGNELLTKQITLENGIGSSYFLIPEGFPRGYVMLQGLFVGENNVLFQKELEIKPIAFPFYLVDISMNNKYYLGGDRLEIDFEGKNYFIEPLKGADYKLTLFNGNYEIGNDKGRLDKEGKGSFGITLPNPLNENGLRLNIELSYKQKDEIASISIPAKRNNVTVEFFPESGNLVSGIPNKMYYKATGPDGDPLQFKGVVINEYKELIAEVSSDKNGEGFIDYIPNEDESIHLSIIEPYAIDWEYNFPEPTHTGLTLKLKEKTADSTLFEIIKYPAIAIDYFFTNVHQGELISFSPITVVGQKEIAMANSSLKEGINHITLFSAQLTPVAELMHFHSKHAKQGPRVSVEDKRYENRSLVNAQFQFSDEVVASFSATDKYRLSSKQTSQNIQSYLLVDSELKDHAVISSGTFFSDELIEQNINSRLGIFSSINYWKDIYRVNGKGINFRSFDVGNKSYEYLNEFYYPSIEGDRLIFRNYGYENFYLGSNPILTAKLDDLFKKHKKEPSYKKLLQNGNSLRDVIFNIKPYKVINNRMVFPGTMNSINHQGGAMFVLDGRMIGEDMSVLNIINPADIETINVSTSVTEIQRYTGLNSVGIVEMTTRGSNIEKDESANVSEEFESPDYSSGSDDWKISEDLRTTIYWNGFQRLSSSPYHYEFYHSDIRCDVNILVEGIDKDGHIFSVVTSYHAL